MCLAQTNSALTLARSSRSLCPNLLFSLHSSYVVIRQPNPIWKSVQPNILLFNPEFKLIICLKFAFHWFPLHQFFCMCTYVYTLALCVYVYVYIHICTHAYINVTISYWHYRSTKVLSLSATWHLRDCLHLEKYESSMMFLPAFPLISPSYFDSPLLSPVSVH